jgi:hypothetical protein
MTTVTTMTSRSIDRQLPLPFLYCLPQSKPTCASGAAEFIEGSIRGELDPRCRSERGAPTG